MVVKTTDFIELENCPIEIWDIEREAIKFYDIIRICESIDEEDDMLDNIRQLQRANLHFTQAKNLVRNLIKPEDNLYISGVKENKESYKWLVDSLGRVDRRLTEFQGDISEKTETQAILRKGYSSIKVVGFYNYLVESMQSLVYYPLKNAYSRYIGTPSTIEVQDDETKLTKKIVKDKDLFIYFLFLEMFHAALSVGAITREDINRPSKQQGFVNTQPIGLPSQFPSNIKTEEAQDQTTGSPNPQNPFDIPESELFASESGDDDYV